MARKQHRYGMNYEEITSLSPYVYGNPPATVALMASSVQAIQDRHAAISGPSVLSRL